ncbi:hypothetical protein HY212_06720 [Candidatus Pacearchaeota archaeon]|nr:hypothetical protein [Candidatus Pacearchaeota archaeon]
MTIDGKLANEVPLQRLMNVGFMDGDKLYIGMVTKISRDEGIIETDFGYLLFINHLNHYTINTEDFAHVIPMLSSKSLNRKK